MVDLNAFTDAIVAGDRTRVQQMLDTDPGLLSTLKQQGTSPVLLALYHNEPDIAAQFVSRGVLLDIFEASAAGQVERVRELVQEDPDLANAYAADGFQPLGLAAYFGHKESVDLLLAYGAAPNSASRNAQRVMPLHSAVAARHEAVAASLLAHGAKVNARQADDFTPLHEAAQNGQLSMVQILVQHGARLNMRTSDGHTPLELAQQAGHHQVADWLQTRGAET